MNEQKIILVPVDFSEASQNAVKYAAEIAKHKNAKIVLFHAYSSGGSFYDLSGQLLADNVLQLKEHSEEQLDKAAVALEQTGLLHKKICRFGSLSHGIEEFVRENRTWLVVMGKNYYGKINELAGNSRTAVIAGRIHVPMLAVPVDAVYRGIHHIAFATDYHYSDTGSLKFLSRLAELFDAQITAVHISDGRFPPAFEKEQMNKFMNEANDQCTYKKINFHLITGRNVIEQLDKFIVAEKPDMLSMATRHYTFVERLFHKSVTKRMIYRARIPLLIFHLKHEPVYIY